jgi:hypothetical protein
MKQNEKKTPIERPALLVVPAYSAIIAVSKQTDSMHPVSPATGDHDQPCW